MLYNITICDFSLFLFFGPYDFVSAPDRLYEVKVWAFNKQTEGYPAVWKGRTEKLTRGAFGYDEKIMPDKITSTCHVNLNLSKFVCVYQFLSADTKLSSTVAAHQHQSSCEQFHLYLAPLGETAL